MKDETKNTILDAKYARIISAISELHSIPMEKAADIFYNSETLLIPGDSRPPIPVILGHPC